MHCLSCVTETDGFVRSAPWHFPAISVREKCIYIQLHFVVENIVCATLTWPAVAWTFTQHTYIRFDTFSTFFALLFIHTYIQILIQMHSSWSRNLCCNCTLHTHIHTHTDTHASTREKEKEEKEKSNSNTWTWFGKSQRNFVLFFCSNRKQNWINYDNYFF